MNSRGPGIFDDDIARDVRSFVEDALAQGRSMPEITEAVIVEFNEVLEDFEDIDEPGLVWLALAAVQLEHGALQPEVMQHALSTIEGGADLERWRRDEPQMVTKRRRAPDRVAGVDTWCSYKRVTIERSSAAIRLWMRCNST